MPKKIIISLFLLLFLSSGILAEGAGITSQNFLKISQGARQSGMGEAFVGIADDVNAIYWNPAGLSQLTRHQVCFMHSEWMIDVRFEYLAYALPIKGVGTLAIYGVILNAGDIAETVDNPIDPFTGNMVSASNMNFTGAFSKRLGDFLGEDNIFSDLSIGINVNYSTEDIASIDSGTGFGANISAYYYPKYQDYSLGLVVRNAGISTNRPSLPLAIQFGMGYRFSLEHMSSVLSDEGYFTFPEKDTVAGIDVTYYPEEAIARVNAGIEKFWNLSKYHNVGLRVGYKFGHDLGVIAGFTGGLGYKLAAGKDTSFEIDYSINPYGDLGIAHRISVTGKFMGKTESHEFVNKEEALEYYKKGYNFLYNKKYADALINFSEALKRNKEYSPALMGMGACFLRMNKRNTAYKAYKLALEYDPTNVKLKEFITSYEWDLQAPEFPVR